MGVDFDDALERVGGFGYIQRLHILILFLVGIFQGPFIMTLVFVGKEPKVSCRGRAHEVNVCDLDPPCQDFVYGTKFTSIVSEWDLVCERNREAAYAQSLVMFGFLAGVVLLGRVADKHGRLKTYSWAMFCLVAVQALSAFTQTLYQYSATRFFVGFFCGGGGLAGHVLMLEALLPKMRALIGSLSHCSFACGIAIYALMAYFVRDWRHLTVVTCIPMVVLILVPLIIPESALWLASKGQTDKAEGILYEMAKKNGLKVSRSMLSLNIKMDETKGKASYSTLDLFRTPIMRRRMMILMITWFTCCLTYYGLTFGAGSFGGNMYINLALSGLVEVPASLLSVCSLNRLGRRPTMAGSLFIASVSCLGVVAFPKSPDGAMSSVQTCLALIGKMGISVSFNTVYLFSSELLPTVLRNTGMGVCSMSARVGGIIAPMLPPFGDRVAYLMFGIAALLSSILDLSLPESLNKPLPETVEEVENPTCQVSPEKAEKLIISEI